MKQMTEMYSDPKGESIKNLIKFDVNSQDVFFRIFNESNLNCLKC